MDIHEAAKALDGGQYGEEGSRDLFKAMKAAGLVAVYGASDDLMMLSGAIDDEVGARDGRVIHFADDGLLTNECENPDCPSFLRLKKTAKTVLVRSGVDDLMWSYSTTIPHATFVIHEDGEPFCRGLVFALPLTA